MKKLLLAFLFISPVMATETVYVTMQPGVIEGWSVLCDEENVCTVDPPADPNADGHYACDSQADCFAWAAETCAWNFVMIYTTAGGNGISCTAMCSAAGWPGTIYFTYTANCG